MASKSSHFNVSFGLILLSAGAFILASACGPRRLERTEATHARCYAPPGELPNTYAGKWVVMLSDQAANLQASGVVILRQRGGEVEMNGSYRWKAGGEYPESKWYGSGKMAGGQLELTARVGETNQTGKLSLTLDHGGSRLTGSYQQGGRSYLVVACRVL